MSFVSGAQRKGLGSVGDVEVPASRGQLSPGCQRGRTGAEVLHLVKHRTLRMPALWEDAAQGDPEGEQPACCAEKWSVSRPQLGWRQRPGVFNVARWGDWDWGES